MANYWLLKSEPSVYSIDDLAKDKKTNWNGIRNFQARNVLKSCKKGDFAFIYHSNDDRAVVGVAKVIKEAYPEVDPNRPGDWVQIDLGFALKLLTPVTLQQIKTTSTLKTLPLIKQSRLSCMPIGSKEFEIILKLGKSWESFQKLK